MSDKNYLSKLPDWSPETACQLAAQESLTFSEAHIEVLEAARQFFDQYGF